MTGTARHGLPLLSAGQAQKEVTHNEALLKIDRLLQVAVETRALSAPPAVPLQHALYVVGPAPDGDWAGHAGRFASHDGFGWTFTDPIRGCLAWIVDEGCFAVFDSIWSDGDWPAAGLLIAGRRMLGLPPAAVAAPSGGTIVDSEARECFSILLVALRDQGLII